MNVKAIDPDKAWGLFQGWAAQRLRHEPAGTTLTLVDYPALRHRPKFVPPGPTSPFLYPIAFLQARRHVVIRLANGLWRVDGATRTTFQILEMVNDHRRAEGMPEVELEHLKGIDR